ncbi:hypothetical protein MHO82_18160 [Vibrio sp. Of7-15]|uniref:hypothetical protein n=1 Tax=Vibrio sp. Of7-15 TaxID=2724879 RepID=UPI001EF34EBB|nr:hypothetical protein [Vibrio sp. Of7-15]MCG7498797.1 hypothetical protein [Vibrio sp. Of7-15]
MSPTQDTEHSDDHKDADVVIIEEPKKAFNWIAVAAAVVGLSAGGLIGSGITTSNWSDAYHSLQTSHTALEQEKKQLNDKLVSQSSQAMQDKAAELLAKEQSMQAEFDKKNTDLIESNQALQDELANANKSNAVLTGKVSELTSQVNFLNNKVELQITMLERAKQLFQNQMVLQHEVADLEEKVAAVDKTITKFKKDCQLYREGKSWDVSSDACTKYDKQREKLADLEEQLRIREMDLREIDSLVSEIGV